MFQDNPLLAQLKKQIQETLPKKEGYIKATDRGFGFLETDNKESILVPAQGYMKNVMHGDRDIDRHFVPKKSAKLLNRKSLLNNQLHDLLVV